MTHLDIVQGKPYSCNGDTLILNSKKTFLDFALKSPNYSPAKLKSLQDDYIASKAKYDASGCGKNVDQDKCLDYQTRIANLLSSITYSLNTRDVQHAEVLKGRLEEEVKKYNDLKCDTKISEYRGGVVMSIAEIFQKMDKERLEAENNYQFRQRLFFWRNCCFWSVVNGNNVR